MQAIVMAAGKGSRLGDLTSDRPKSFVEINGRSLMDINLRLLRDKGIEEIVIVTGCHAEMFEEKYGREKDVRLIYNPFYAFTNVIGSFYMGMDALHDDFIYLHADTLFEPSILEQILESPFSIALPVDVGPCDEEAMKVKKVKERIMYINKKLNPTDCEGEFIGVAKIKASVLPSLRKRTRDLLREEAYAEYFEAALERVLQEGKTEAEMIDVHGRFWAEIDFAEDLERARLHAPQELTRF